MTFDVSLLSVLISLSYFFALIAFLIAYKSFNDLFLIFSGAFFVLGTFLMLLGANNLEAKGHSKIKAPLVELFQDNANTPELYPSEISEALLSSPNPDCISDNLEKILDHGAELLTANHLDQALTICLEKSAEKEKENQFLAKKELQRKALGLVP